MILSHTKEKCDMYDLTAAVPDDATLIKDDDDTVIGATWRADGSGPWPGEAWKFASIHYGKTVSVRHTEAEAVHDVRTARG